MHSKSVKLVIEYNKNIVFLSNSSLIFDPLNQGLSQQFWSNSSKPNFEQTKLCALLQNRILIHHPFANVDTKKAVWWNPRLGKGSKCTAISSSFLKLDPDPLVNQKLIFSNIQYVRLTQDLPGNNSPTSTTLHHHFKNFNISVQVFSSSTTFLSSSL